MAGEDALARLGRIDAYVEDLFAGEDEPQGRLNFRFEHLAADGLSGDSIRAGARPLGVGRSEEI